LEFILLLLIITGWGQSGKVILQVSISVFSASVKKFFGQRWLSTPRKKLAHTPMADILSRPRLRFSTTDSLSVPAVRLYYTTSIVCTIVRKWYTNVMICS